MSYFTEPNWPIILRFVFYYIYFTSIFKCDSIQTSNYIDEIKREQHRVD